MNTLSQIPENEKDSSTVFSHIQPQTADKTLQRILKSVDMPDVKKPIVNFRARGRRKIFLLRTAKIAAFCVLIIVLLLPVVLQVKAQDNASVAKYHLEQTEAGSGSAFAYIQSHEKIADTIVIHLNDPEKELDLAAAYAQSESGAHLLPLAIDEQARSITFAFPDEIISIYLSGRANKVLQITLRPDAS